MTIYIDNYFTLIPLFNELQSLNYGAVSMTRPHFGFLDGLVALKDKFSLKLDRILS